MTPKNSWSAIDRDVERHYNRMSQICGNSISAVGWYSRKTQWRRFDILASDGFIPGATLLDVGCGLGDWVDYQKRSALPPIRYTGIDLSSGMLEIARRRFPNEIFQQNSFFSYTAQTDYLIASGTFNRSVPNPIAYISSVIQHGTSLTIIRFSFNLLINTPKNTGKSDEFMYFDPQDILRLKPADWNMGVTTGYLNNDFTIHLTPGDSQA